MTLPRLLMSSPDVGELEEQAVLRAVRSGWIAPTGPELAAFEAEVAARVGVEHAVALSSGTAGLHLALLGVGVRPGDVVIVATMTFVATANAVTYSGAVPYFVDVLEEDGNIDIDVVAEALKALRADGRPVGAVVSVDLLGKTADYTALTVVCDEYEVPLVEDAAEAVGSAHAGRAAGAWGRAGVLSFNGNKIMTTSGGGMLLTEDAALADRARHLATQAREPVLHYEHVEIGYNYRLSNVLAALGRAQLSRLDAMIERRRAIRVRYAAAIQSLAGVRILGSRDESESNCWLTALVIHPETARVDSACLGRLLDAAGIEARPLWKPMHLQPAYIDAPRVDRGVAEKLFCTGVTLPSGSSLDDTAIDRVIAVLDHALGGAS